ncbi:hypothetical protein CR513_18623, partial [Mucuna pruriens]
MRNLVKKPLRKKDLTRISSPSSQGRSTPYGKRREDLNGRTTPKSSPKRLTIKVKWCSMSTRSLNTSSLNVQVRRRRKRRRKRSLSLRRIKVLWHHGKILIYLHVEKRMKKQISALWLTLLQKEKKMMRESENLEEDKAKNLSRVNTPKRYTNMVPRLWLLMSHDRIKNNLYTNNLKDLTNQSVTCLVSIKDNQWTWHKKLKHASLRLISKLKHINLVRGIPTLVYKAFILCDGYQKGKYVKGSFESKNIILTSRHLELLHIDLFGPTKLLP